ncbi:glycosyltransferase family 2 protein [Nocardioides sp. zg-1230]|nr:glycosyltransferase family 2 protein [Nocardioides sp. zg-1230]
MTYNRESELRRCLQALDSQTRASDHIIVIDNNSTDGTRAFLSTLDLRTPVTVVRSAENVGGAGGFSLGIALAIEEQFDLAWIMDDDVLPEPDALSELLRARDLYTSSPPAVLASLVIDTDGNLGQRNRSVPESSTDPAGYRRTVEAAGHGLAAIKYTTFVGAMIDLELARETSLPVVDYFIWHDDTEYTARLCSLGGGVLVPTSRVVHLAEHLAPGKAVGPRLFYDVRNKLWLSRSGSLSRLESLTWLYQLGVQVGRQFKESEDKRSYTRTIARAVRDGVASKPRYMSHARVIESATFEQLD